MLGAAEESNPTPPPSPHEPVPICPEGKFPPDAIADNQLFPKHVSKASLLIPQSGYAFQDMPKPYSPSTWSHLRGFQEWPNVLSLISLRVKNSGRAPVGVTKPQDP